MNPETINPVLPEVVNGDENNATISSPVIDKKSCPDALNYDSNIVNDNHQDITNSDNEKINKQSSIDEQPSNFLKDFFLKEPKALFEKWKDFNCNKEKEKLRNEINDAFILNTGEAVTTENITSILEKGSFFVARRIWNDLDGKYHDHYVFVKEKLEDHLDVIHICDISLSGSKPIEEAWSFSMMIEAMKTEEASLIKFSFYDLEDDVGVILERAMNYRIPKDEVRSFHFPCSVAFGKKLPIFSAKQLQLCKEKTLLLFEHEDKESDDEEIAMVLHSVDEDGILNVSLQYNESEVKSFKDEELFNYEESSYNIYYLPNSPIEPPEPTNSFSSISIDDIKDNPKMFAKKLLKRGIKAGKNNKGELLKDGITDAFADKMAIPKLAQKVGETSGEAVCEVAIFSVEAGVATYRSRKKEKMYEESGGVKGFSRSRANRTIAEECIKAIAGTVGAISTGALLAAGGAAVGQIACPIPVVGATVGAAVVFAGSTIGGVAAGKIGGLVSNKIYQKNMETKCPFCQRYKTKSCNPFEKFKDVENAFTDILDKIDDAAGNRVHLMVQESSERSNERNELYDNEDMFFGKEKETKAD